MARPIWYVNLLKKAFLNIKFIAKLTRIPFSGKIFDFAMFEGDDIIYLPEDKVIPALRQIYAIMNGRAYEDMLPPVSILNNPREFARRFIFDLEPAKPMPYGDKQKLNERLLYLLTQA